MTGTRGMMMKTSISVLVDLLNEYSVFAVIHIWREGIMIVEVKVDGNTYWIITGDYIASVFDGEGYLLESFNNVKDFERVLGTLFTYNHITARWKGVSNGDS